MSEALTASLPETLDLPDGYVVRWAAVNPATGADVAGVKVSNVSLFGTLLGLGTGAGGGDGGGTLTLGPYALIPGPEG